MIRKTVSQQLAFAFLALLSVAACAQTTYQPTGSRVAVSNGSTFFYYEVLNPSTNQKTSVTLYINCGSSPKTAVFEEEGQTQKQASIIATCLVPGQPRPATVQIIQGGEVQENGMFLTLEPGDYVISHGRNGDYVSSMSMPLVVN